MAKFVCPECSKRELVDHCASCNWLYCSECSVVIGPHKSIIVGQALKKAEEAERRRNGV